MGKIITIIQNGHVTGTPTYFVDPGDPKKNNLTVNVTVNGPKKKDGTRDADCIAVKFWGKYAGIAAHQLDNGSGVNIDGLLKTWKRDTGKVDAAGKKIFEEKITVRGESFSHTGAIEKEQTALVVKNIAAFNAAKAMGQIHPAAELTPAIILKKPEPVVVPDFNLAVASQTGRYGFAKVWTKDRGFIGPQNPAPAAVAQPVQVAALPANLMSDLAKMVIAMQAAEKAGAVVQPVIASADAAEAAGAQPVDGFEGA